MGGAESESAMASARKAGRGRTTRRLLLAAVLAGACVPGAPPQAPPAGTRPPEAAAAYDPAQALGVLFHDVQLARVFADSKTFVDSRPRLPPARILAAYQGARNNPGFDLRSFVERYFEVPPTALAAFHADTALAMEAHIRALWPVLTRPTDPPGELSSLLPLPQPYVVPGGRFREIYYWDSYFTMLGLVESGRVDLVRAMLDNFAYLIGRFGHVPNGNRSYYLSRSQPPFFAAMVGRYAAATDTSRALAYLPALEAEHAFWMAGAERLVPGEAYRRVVRLPDGSVLNRYWDDRPEPRPESYREDWTLAQTLPAERRAGLYRELRATAESGWDFSSRWLRDPTDLRTLETTALAPVDLNSLLYHAEQVIAALRSYRGQPGDADVARRFTAAAEARRRAMLMAAFDAQDSFFYDVRWRTGERVVDRPTMAAAAPLYFGLATPEQGRAVAARLERELLAPGGFLTTRIASGQQWDAPNGWAPLQWLGAEGVRRYGRADLADAVRARWLALNRRTYRATGRMMEKYDVADPGRPAGGGEYPSQDGFGWSNGVALAFAAQLRPPRERRREPAGPTPGAQYDTLHVRAAAAPGARRPRAARWLDRGVRSQSPAARIELLPFRPTGYMDHSVQGEL